MSAKNRRGKYFNPAFLVGIVLLAIILFIVGEVYEHYKNGKSGKPDTTNSEEDTRTMLLDSAMEKKLPLPVINKNDEIIKHLAYTLSFSKKDEEPSWVAYRLTAWMAAGNEKRTGDFREDPDVSNGSALPEDYKRSGYDRGHICPAGDMKWSKEAMSETFFMSNMTPQDHGFNDGIWAHLENKVRNWSKQYGEVFITAGPVLKGDMKKIGKNKVSVPSYFYKVILAPEGNTYKGIGFIIPNKNLHESFYHYAVSIDSVQKLTHIDFFPLLPDSAEKRIESGFSLEQWR